MESFFDISTLAAHQRWVMGKPDGLQLTMQGRRINDPLLANANLIGAEFVGCEFVATVFRAVEFNGGRFHRCQFRSCAFERCILQDVRMDECEAFHATFVDSALQSLGATGTRFDHVDFSRGDLTKSMFYESAFVECRFDGAKLKRADFTKCNLRGCSFRASNAERTNFSDSDLRGADFEKLAFEQTRFTRCGLAGIRGTPQNINGALLTAPDCSVEFDGSGIVAEATVLRDWADRR